MTWLFLPLLGCDPEPKSAPPADSEPPVVIDEDGDGYPAEEDCDDDDAAVHPEADDAPYDGLDADCAGDSDYDADGDGADAVEHGGDDCDDADAGRHPGATEECDGLDNDCDGEAEPADAEDGEWWTDADSDGYGDETSGTWSCGQPEGTVANGEDCDDADATVNPGVVEVACNGRDDDCDRSYGDGLATADGVTWMALQDAVDSLAATGGALTLCEGRFSAVTIDIAGQLAIQGSELGSTIHGGGVTSAVFIESGEVTLQDLEITGGVGSTPGSAVEPYGGGILVYTEDPLHVVDCDIENNEATYGAGIYMMRRGTVEIVGTQLIDNSASYGGGIYGAGDNTLTLSDVYITDNEASSGAGIQLESGAVVTADVESYVTDNHATTRGGGIDLAGDSTWSGGEVDGNTAPTGAGMAISCADEHVSLTDLLILDNFAETDGGGLAIACSVTAENVTLYDNMAGLEGGGFILEGVERVTLTACTITDNRAGDGRGGGAQIDDGVLESVGSDWGEADEDNDPVDIRLGDDTDAEQVEYSYGADATFTCTASGTKECL